MLSFLKKLFGFAETPQEPAPYKVEAPAPYKVEAPAPEPAQCGCGRSTTGLCVGLHKLTPEEWAVHTDNPAKAVPKAEAKPKAPAKPKTAAKPKAPAKPRAPKKTATK